MFKEFIIHQDKCSMKVCTDSCLFGALVAEKVTQLNKSPKYILDIGAGTGILGLMLAQKASAKIDAVEIEKNAFEQAQENFNASPWKIRLNIFHSDIKQWTAPRNYDMIITNPPFFENDLVSGDSGKNISKHNAGILLEEFFPIVHKILKPDGNFAILLPWSRSIWFENKALKEGLYVKEKTDIRQTDNRPFFRTAYIFQKEKTEKNENQLSIRNNKNWYSNEFRELLKDYYLQH
jgi:tRNA1Val (adenine37-N6)-methyltransferase